MTDVSNANSIESFPEDQVPVCYHSSSGYYAPEPAQHEYKSSSSMHYMVYKDVPYAQDGSERLVAQPYYLSADGQMQYKHVELGSDLHFQQTNYNANSQLCDNDASNANSGSHAAQVARIEFAKKWGDAYKTLMTQNEAQNCYSGVMNEKAQYKQLNRPELDLKVVEMLNDLSEFLGDDCFHSYIIKYTPRTVFHLGEGGRELIRACLNLKGCKGKQLQGASVPMLFNLANKWGLWNIALRINIERKIGVYSPYHAAFTRFKANQSHMRKYVIKEYMVTNRDNDGRISNIVYQENRKIILGKEGREALRTQLRQLHGKHPKFMDAILERHGFKYAELRNATVNQLSRMAFICNLWDNVVNVCRKQEEINDKIKRRRCVKSSSDTCLDNKFNPEPNMGVVPMHQPNVNSVPLEQNTDPLPYCKSFPESYPTSNSTSVSGESPYLNVSSLTYLNCDENTQSSANTQNYYTNFWSNDSYELQNRIKYNYSYPSNDAVSIHWN